MAITTNFSGLKGNTIKVISTTAGVNPGDDTTIILGEFASDGITEITPNVRTTLTVQGGKRGTEVTTGSGTPDDANGVKGDIYLDTGTDQIYVKDSDSSWGAADSDFTGSRGASIANVTGTPTAVQFVDSDGVDVGSPLDLKGDKGDTGSTTLPDQTGNAGKYLTTDGTDESWGDLDLSSKQDTLTTAQLTSFTEGLNETEVDTRVTSGITGKQDTITAGDNLSFDGNTLNATSGSGVGTFETEGIESNGIITYAFDGIAPVGTTDAQKFSNTTGFDTNELGISEHANDTTLRLIFENGASSGKNASGTNTDIFGGDTGETKVQWLDKLVNSVNTDDGLEFGGSTAAKIGFTAARTDNNLILTWKDGISFPSAGALTFTAGTGTGISGATMTVTQPASTTAVVGQTFTQGVSLVYFNSVLYFRTGSTITTTAATTFPSATGSGWSSIGLTEL